MEVALVGGGNTAFWWMRRCLDQARLNTIPVWAVGSVGFAIRCEKIFSLHTADVMQGADPYLSPEVPGGENQLPAKTLAELIGEYKKTGAEVVTTDGHDGTEMFPLAEIIEMFGYPNFTCGASMMIAYAMLKGATRLHIYGLDFDYGAEAGADCVNFWLGRAAERKVAIEMARSCNLMGTKTLHKFGIYGYGFVQPVIEKTATGYRLSGFKDHRK